MHISGLLKSVLPVLVPIMRDDNFPISDGNQTIGAFLSIVELKDPIETEHLGEALWKYCKLETLAMLRILEELRNVSERWAVFNVMLMVIFPTMSSAC